ncbi:MAG: hypothetical protein WD750_02115 [Gammaproteobacteria bacterium]
MSETGRGRREWRFYPGMDDDTLWSIIATDVPELLTALRQLGNRPE